MTKFNTPSICAGVWSVALVAAISQGVAIAADLAGPPAIRMAGQDPASAYDYGGFSPALDPRCRIVPQPEASLYGDTARFRPTAVCQSRGLYADSVLLP